MALKSLNNDFNLSPDELLEEALFINSFVDPGYWNHSKYQYLHIIMALQHIMKNLKAFLLERRQNMQSQSEILG